MATPINLQLRWTPGDTSKLSAESFHLVDDSSQQRQALEYAEYAHKLKQHNVYLASKKHLKPAWGSGWPSDEQMRRSQTLKHGQLNRSRSPTRAHAGLSTSDDYVRQLEQQVNQLAATVGVLQRGEQVESQPQRSAAASTAQVDPKLLQKIESLAVEHEKSLRLMEGMAVENEQSRRRTAELEAELQRLRATASKQRGGAMYDDTTDTKSEHDSSDSEKGNDDAGSGSDAGVEDDIAWTRRIRRVFLQEEVESDDDAAAHSRPSQPMATGRVRPSSAHGSRDYHVVGSGHNRRAVSTKPLTTAKPFKVAERPTASTRGIAARRRMEEQKRREEEEAELAAARQFKAKPIPKTTTMPLYEKIVRQQDAARQLGNKARKEVLNSMMQPFEGVESRHQRSKQKWQQKMQKQKEEEMENLRASRTFKANPIPDTINGNDRFLQQLQEREATRKDRIKERAEQVRESAALPPRMERWNSEKKKKEMQRSAEADAAAKQRKSIMSANSAKVSDFKSHFKQQHERWEASLQQAKSQRGLTKEQPFSFATKEKLQEAEMRKKEVAAKWQEQWQAGAQSHGRSLSRSSRSAGSSGEGSTQRRRKSTSGPVTEPYMTKAVKLRAEALAKSLEEKRQAEERKKREEADRQRRHREASKEVAPIVRAMEKHRRAEPLAWQIEGDLDAVKATRKQQVRDASRQRRTLQTGISKAQAGRPFLFERANIATSEQNARRVALLTVARSYAGGQGAASMGDVASGRVGGSVFDDVDRAILQDDDSDA